MSKIYMKNELISELLLHIWMGLRVERIVQLGLASSRHQNPLPPPQKLEAN